MLFLLPKVEYLGHTISADGLQPTNGKIRAITQAPVPRDVKQLRSLPRANQLLWEVYREPFQSPVPTLQAIGEGKTLELGGKTTNCF